MKAKYHGRKYHEMIKAPVELTYYITEMHSLEVPTKTLKGSKKCAISATEQSVRRWTEDMLFT